MSPQSYHQFTKPDLQPHGHLLYADTTWNPTVLSYHNSCVYWYTHVPQVSFFISKDEVQSLQNQARSEQIIWVAGTITDHSFSTFHTIKDCGFEAD